jgi:hypothetical protein
LDLRFADIVVGFSPANSSLLFKIQAVSVLRIDAAKPADATIYKILACSNVVFVISKNYSGIPYWTDKDLQNQ